MDYSIKKANEYITSNSKTVNKKYKPLFHFSPPIGWINDPNGLIYYKNQYHIFYQYYPYNTMWGPMHWGHAVSDDLIKFRDLPVSLAPDTPNEDGCFSGGAIINESKDKSELNLFYTRHYEENKVIKQTQCRAISYDGITFKKQDEILGIQDIPNNASKTDFRDPRPVFHKGKYYLFVGSKTNDNKGQILVYSSNNLDYFEYFCSIGPFDFFGDMVECPDFFSMGNKDILIVSVMGLKSDGTRFKNSHSSIYVVGEFDIENKIFKVDSHDELDGGFDFYAPQTLFDSNNRRIMLAWMEMWGKNYYLHENKHGYNGCLTFPRELTLINDKLVQNPINEVIGYHSNKIICSNSCIVPKHLDANFVFSDEDAQIIFSNTLDSEDYFKIGVHTKILYLDCSHLKNSSYGKRQSKLRSDKYQVRMLLDTSSVEIFINGGEDTLTSNVYIESNGCRMCIKGNLAIYDVFTLETKK